MMHVVPSRLLQTALAWNAAVGATFALLQLIQPFLAARLFELPLELVIVSGVVLAAYVLLLVWMLSSATFARALVWLLNGVNFAWAAVSVGFAAWSSATPLGIAYLVLQAVAAAAFTVAHTAGLQRSVSMTDASAKLLLRDAL